MIVTRLKSVPAVVYPFGIWQPVLPIQTAQHLPVVRAVPVAALPPVAQAPARVRPLRQALRPVFHQQVLLPVVRPVRRVLVPVMRIVMAIRMEPIHSPTMPIAQILAFINLNVLALRVLHRVVTLLAVPVVRVWAVNPAMHSLNVVTVIPLCAVSNCRRGKPVAKGRVQKVVNVMKKHRRNVWVEPFNAKCLFSNTP